MWNRQIGVYLDLPWEYIRHTDITAIAVFLSNDLTCLDLWHYIELSWQTCPRDTQYLLLGRAATTETKQPLPLMRLSQVFFLASLSEISAGH